MRDLWKLLAYLAEDLVPFLSHSNSPEALDFIEKNGLIYQQFNTIAAVRVWQWPLKCHQLSIISTDWIAKNPTSSCRFIGSERSLFYCLSLLLNNTRYKHARKNKRLKLVPSSGSLLNESNRRIKEIDGYEQLDFSSERWQQLFKDFCRDSFWKRKKKKKKKNPQGEMSFLWLPSTWMSLIPLRIYKTNPEREREEGGYWIAWIQSMEFAVIPIKFTLQCSVR